MRGLQLLSVALLGAIPTSAQPGATIVARQSNTTTQFCVAQDPPPSEAETEARFNKFANAFIVTKNLSEAFSYISGTTYINHNPSAEDGAQTAFDLLSSIWPTSDITPIRTLFVSPQGWLNYNVSGLGETVDRFRWEAGCIVEHWDEGEVFPSSNGTASTSSTSPNSTVSTSNPTNGPAISESSTTRYPGQWHITMSALIGAWYVYGI